MILRELTNEEFNNFTENFKDKSIYQTSEYANTMNHQNYNSIILGLVDNNNVLAATLLLIEENFKFKYAYAPRGFLIDYENDELLDIFIKKIKIFLRKIDVMAVKINPHILKNVYQKNSVIENINYDNIFDKLKKMGFYHLGYNNLFEGFKPRFEAILDINKPYNELFNNISKNYKTKIRSASKKGVRVYKGTKNDLSFLYSHTHKKYPRDLKYYNDCYNYFKKRDMIEFYYTKLDTKYYLNLIQKKYTLQEEVCFLLNQLIIAKKDSKNKNKLLNRKMHNDLLLSKLKKQLVEAIKLLKIYPEGLVTASILIIKHNGTISLIIDGHDPKYKSLNSKHLLIWKLIEKYSNLNYKNFNLGGVTNPTLKDNKYKGLNDFKTEFNADIYEYIGDLELITNKTLYFMYRNSAPIRNMINK